MRHPNTSPFAPVQLAVTALTCIVILFSCTSTSDIRNGMGLPAIRVCLNDEHSSARIFFAKDAFLIGTPEKVSIKEDAVYECLINDAGRLVVVQGSEVIAEFDGPFRAWYPDPKQRFGFEGNRYSDTLIIARDKQHIVVVNELPLDRYLESVVPNEIGRNLTDKEYAAAEAQAILARTYAMSRIDLPVKRLFHVYDDTRDQVFTGMMNRNRTTSGAVRESAGYVLMKERTYAECYFHAVCGGHTEAVGGAWPGHEPRPYLAGISDSGPQGDYCRSASSYRWSEEYTREELEGILRTSLPTATDDFTSEDSSSNTTLLDIKITERTASGRVHELHLYLGTPSDYTDVVLRGDRIRRALLRPDAKRMLRRTLFDITMNRDAKNWITSVRIDGGGNGHGVGMCQWGAIERARWGADAETILEVYYPGTSVTRLY